jgi:hypothetical protein
MGGKTILIGDYQVVEKNMLNSPNVCDFAGWAVKQFLTQNYTSIERCKFAIVYDAPSDKLVFRAEWPGGRWTTSRGALQSDGPTVKVRKPYLAYDGLKPLEPIGGDE